MSNGKLRCWMRYSDSGNLYRTCKETKETKMAKMIPQEQLDKEFDEARDLVAKAKALRRINEKRREMTIAQRELAQMADADKESADLLLAKFATPVGQEEPSAFIYPSNPESALSNNLRRMGWSVQFSRRNPSVPYYFNKKTGESLYRPPVDPLLAPRGLSLT